MILKNARVVDEHFDIREADLWISGERIASVAPHGTFDASDDGTLDLSGRLVIPGFVDIHIHGCSGADTGDATPEALGTMSRTLAGHGVTSFCPTSMTVDGESLTKIFANVAGCRARGLAGAYIQGINMEGPYISMKKKGAQNPAFVRTPDREEFLRLNRECGGLVRLVDIAPEEPGSDEFIRAAAPVCAVSIAHTNADYATARHSFDVGIRHATHLFNAMSGLTHRAPGVVGAVFDDDRVTAELICDGFHIAPAVLRIAFRLLGEDRVCVVSDSLKAAGCPDGEYDLGGQPVFVKNGKALLSDGTIAASTANLHEEFKNLLSFGIPFRQALKACTINPAREVRADAETGSIRVGKLADLVVLDADNNIDHVFIRGRRFEG